MRLSWRFDFCPGVIIKTSVVENSVRVLEWVLYCYQNVLLFLLFSVFSYIWTYRQLCEHRHPLSQRYVHHHWIWSDHLISLDLSRLFLIIINSFGVGLSVHVDIFACRHLSAPNVTTIIIKTKEIIFTASWKKKPSTRWVNKQILLILNWIAFRSVQKTKWPLLLSSLFSNRAID